MATYLQGVTDQIPNIQPFQPNFGLVQKALSTLQARYDRGFASVQNVYNQVMNAPLSIDENKAMRALFLKDSQMKLKDIASVDLSLPENQAVAENVFSPFWEDDLILKDSDLTRSYQNELQKALSTRDSQDEKIREQYSGVAVRYLEDGLRKLQQAGRDPQKYAQLEKRRFVPFKSIEKYLNDQAEKLKFKVERVNAQGQYLVTTENGIETITSFETFADNMLGTGFQEQFRVMGAVEKEERIRRMKQANPLLTDEQVMEKIAGELTTQLKKGKVLREEKLQDELDKTNHSINEYKSLSELSPDQDKALQGLVLRQATLEEEVSKAKKESTDFTTKEKNTQQALQQNLDGYFTSMLREQSVNGWANASAANQKTTISINPVWKENNEVAYRERLLEIQKRTADLADKTYELEVWKAQHPVVKGKRTGTESGTGGSGSSGTDDDDNDTQDPEVAGKFEGIGARNIVETGNLHQLFVERQQQRYGVANAGLLSQQVAGQLLFELNVGTEDAVKYRAIMEKMMTDPDGKSLKPDERTLMHTIDMKLTGKKDANAADINFFKLRTNLLEAIKNNLASKYKEGGIGHKDTDDYMLTAYQASTWALKEHDALEEQRKVLVKERITKDYDTYEKILVKKNGVYDIANLDDMAKDFKQITVLNASSNETITLSPRQFAEVYINGDFKYAGYGDVTIGNQLYRIREFDGKTGGFDTIRAFNDFYYDRRNDIAHKTDPNAVEYKYGTSQEQKKLRDQLNEVVIPNLPEYQSQTGRQGYVIRYDFTKPEGDIAADLIQEAAQPANHLGFYIDGAYSKSDKKNAAITTLMSLNERDMEQFVSSALIKTVGPTGRPALQLILKPNKTSDKTAVTGVDLTDLTDIKAIDIELNPDASAPTLKQLRYNSGVYAYGSLMRGKVLPSDPILEAAGYSLNIYPNHPERPTGAIVELKYNNYIDGKYVPAPLARQEYFFNQITPDELVRNSYAMVWQQMDKNKEAKSLYEIQMKQQTKQQTGQFRTPQQVIDDVKKQIKLRGG